MPTLKITRKGTSKQDIVLTAEDGSIIEMYTADLMTQKAQQSLIAKTGVKLADLCAAVLQVLPKNSSPVELQYAAPGCSAEPFALRVRGKHQPKEDGKTIDAATPAEALKLALALSDYPEAEPIIEWEGTDRLCCLDVDYHTVPFDLRPDHATLEHRAAVLHPRPFAFHASHGRGCKLFFDARDGFTALELAAVAALGWNGADGRATYDLISRSSHPLYPRPGKPAAGSVFYQTPDADLAAVNRWLGRSLDTEARDDWLAERGWAVGEALPHTCCPIYPKETDSKAPVFLSEYGITCQRCAAKGDAHPSAKRPGWVPWVAIVGGIPSRMAGLVKSATHWAHARLVLQHETGLPESLLRPAYTAAVKMKHGVDVGNAAANAGAELIRMQGRWVSVDGTVTYQQHLHGMLNALPAVWVPGTNQVAADRRDLFLQPGDLSEYGYPAVTPIHGCKVYGQHLTYADDRVPVVTPATWARHPQFRPRYQPLNTRMNVSEAKAKLEVVVPGIDWNYCELCIALKGFAEGGATQAPFVIVTGPSSSAKSSTVHVAASICGDTATEPIYNPDTTRLMQAVASGLDAGSFVVLNEPFKEAMKAKLAPRAAVDPILTLTPSSVSHRLYIGPRPLGRLPALVLTDVSVPYAVQADLQLARRLVWVELKKRVDWIDSIGKAGIGDPGKLRLWTPEAAQACDAILSDVIDRFFRDRWSLAEVAKELGFGTLESLGAVADMRTVMKALFEATIAAPDLTGQYLERYPAPGWKRIDRGDVSTMRDAWDALADGTNGNDWYDSRVIRGEDYGKVLGFPAGSIAVDFAQWKSALFIRFRVGSRTDPSWVSAHGVAAPTFVM